MSKKKIFSRRKSDFIVKAMPAGGPGGQHSNKVATAIRITDKETGLSAVSRELKSQHQNKKAAFNKLAKMLVAHYVVEDEKQRFGSTERVRTYNEPDNRVVDHKTGMRYEYKNTVGKGDISQLIEDRRRKIDE